MKKILYAILACIIVIGIIITLTNGLNVDVIYSKNVEIDVYVGKQVNIQDIKSIAKEIFPNERIIVQKIELFDDMISITMAEKSDEDLKEQIEQLNTKINEKYETENKVEEAVRIIHNPKIRLFSIIEPYILPIVISAVIILIYVIIRYKDLGILKTIASYILSVLVAEGVYFSIIAITRFPVNRLIIPIGLSIYIAMVTILGFINERKLKENIEENKKNK